ncbi:hypothetical protein RHMOL_Rhmol11G0062800 [Rhododendron molle]|uniref:Uncharacterized protein n=1 Tax=Rhododendron molle TaxID=49168 RepID=A0ACC0LP40_RHOML|nr:hypothetical protein RHMOL_Rhmol11G0062800 [Rhododendron molle]
MLINNKGEIKIADFEASGVVSRKLNVTASHHDNCTGTCAYMSPERFDPERWDGNFSDEFAGDIWSLGLVVLECHVGHFPLISPGQKLDWATLMCAICFGGRMDMPEMASPEFQSFVWRCLERDWRKRGTATELLSHPFVTKCWNTSSSGTKEFMGYALEAGPLDQLIWNINYAVSEMFNQSRAYALGGEQLRGVRFQIAWLLCKGYNVDHVDVFVKPVMVEIFEVVESFEYVAVTKVPRNVARPAHTSAKVCNVKEGITF